MNGSEHNDMYVKKGMRLWKRVCGGGCVLQAERWSVQVANVGATRLKGCLRNRGTSELTVLHFPVGALHVGTSCVISVCSH